MSVKSAFTSKLGGSKILAVTVFAHLIENFEKEIMNGKEKLSENQRLFFLSGVTAATLMINECVKDASASGDLQKSISFTIQLKEECRAFERLEIHNFHKFFCPDCAKEDGVHHEIS